MKSISLVKNSFKILCDTRVELYPQLCSVYPLFFNIQNRQKSILKRLDKEPNEMTVWYPSRDEYVEDICHKGIDFDMDISTGPIGKGKYFFRSAYEAHERKASKRYKNGERAYMFLCEVLIGDSQKV